MPMRRFITLLVSILLTLPVLAGENLPAKPPLVLVIGKNGLSTNLEPHVVESADSDVQLANTNSIVYPTGETVVESGTEVVIDGETASATAPAPVQPAIDWAPLVSAMEIMIEQQKMSMLAMEKTRSESMLSAKEASIAMHEKMDSMEQALADQRTHEAESIARMNRLVVGVSSGFAGTGFVVMIFTAWFFMRTTNKMSEINADLQTQLLALPHFQQPMVGDGSSHARNPSSRRLVDALDQLEKRIRGLEHTSEDDSGGPSVGTSGC